MKIIVHSDRIGEKLMDKKEFALKQHEDWHGKIEVVSRAKVTNREELLLHTHRVLQSLVLKFQRTWICHINTQDVQILLPL